jgi:hypothetical protein
MPNPFGPQSGGRAQLHGIFRKILNYLTSLPDGRAVELDELKREHILSPEDLEFMSSQSVTYKPRKMSAYKRGQYVLQMDTGHGYVALGLGGEPTKRRTPLRDFPAVIQRLFEVSESNDEINLMIHFLEHEWMSMFPGNLMFSFKSPLWRERVPAIRGVASDLGLEPSHDYETERSHTIVYPIPSDAAGVSAGVIAILSRGCGLADDSEIVYSSVALDES